MRDLPQSFGRARIASENHGRISVAHHETKCRNHVVDTNRRNSKSIGFDSFLSHDPSDVQKRRHVLRESNEIRPHQIVKNVILNIVKRIGASINAWTVPGGCPCVLYEDREACRVIAVRMSEE